jgi:PTH2 family peptidyl-tRNA hydrolase
MVCIQRIPRRISKPSQHPVKAPSSLAGTLKQVIVVNNELKPPKGKLASQVAHAAAATFLEADQHTQKTWVVSGTPKVVLRAHCAEDTLFLDPGCGKTAVPEGTVTCLGLGPAREYDLDPLTGDLELLR